MKGLLQMNGDCDRLLEMARDSVKHLQVDHSFILEKHVRDRLPDETASELMRFVASSNNNYETCFCL